MKIQINQAQYEALLKRALLPKGFSIHEEFYLTIEIDDIVLPETAYYIEHIGEIVKFHRESGLFEVHEKVFKWIQEYVVESSKNAFEEAKPEQIQFSINEMADRLVNAHVLAHNSHTHYRRIILDLIATKYIKQV